MKITRKLTLLSKRLVMMLLGLSVLITSCKKTSNTIQRAPGILNVINASPGSLSINFFLNNVFVNGPSLFFTERSGYIETYTGPVNFHAAVGGTNQLIVTSTINLESAKYYSMFFTGLNQSPELVFTQDDLSIPSAGKAKIRFMHLSPDAATLDLAVKGVETLFGARIFRSVSDFIELDPKIYNFQLKSSTSAVLAEGLNVPIEAGKIYTIWAGGLVSGSGSTALSIQVMANK